MGQNTDERQPRHKTVYKISFVDKALCSVEIVVFALIRVIFVQVGGLDGHAAHRWDSWCCGPMRARPRGGGRSGAVAPPDLCLAAARSKKSPEGRP